MLNYLIRRLVQVVIVLIIVSILVFLALRLLPGDPIRLLLTSSQQGQASQEQIDMLRKQAGLDRALPIQYVNWMGGVLHGDLGKSILYQTPVAPEIMRRIPITFQLGISAFVLAILIGLPAGVICATRRGTWIDTLVTTLANIGITVPTFWLGLILIYLFGLELRWLPVMGYTSPFTNLGLSLKQMVMPVICLTLFPTASFARQTRSAMLGVMRQDYIRTAWSKGLNERIIVFRHALKNSLIPVVTVMGSSASMVIGGSVIMETVFNIPGIGRLAVDSITNQDYTYVQAVVLIISAFVVTMNLLVDISYGYLDPRIRYS